MTKQSQQPVPRPQGAEQAGVPSAKQRKMTMPPPSWRRTQGASLWAGTPRLRASVTQAAINLRGGRQASVRDWLKSLPAAAIPALMLRASCDFLWQHPSRALYACNQ
ncbi:hypothetical protein N2152v2_005586 [Parachlorella kessleri]